MQKAEKDPQDVGAKFRDFVRLFRRYHSGKLSVVNKDRSSQRAMRMADLCVFSWFSPCVCVCVCVCVGVCARWVSVIPVQLFAEPKGPEHPRLARGPVHRRLSRRCCQSILCGSWFSTSGHGDVPRGSGPGMVGAGRPQASRSFWEAARLCPGYRASAEDQGRASWLPQSRPSSSVRACARVFTSQSGIRGVVRCQPLAPSLHCSPGRHPPIPFCPFSSVKDHTYDCARADALQNAAPSSAMFSVMCRCRQCRSTSVLQSWRHLWRGPRERKLQHIACKFCPGHRNILKL